MAATWVREDQVGGELQLRCGVTVVGQAASGFFRFVGGGMGRREKSTRVGPPIGLNMFKPLVMMILPL